MQAGTSYIICPRVRCRNGHNSLTMFCTPYNREYNFVDDVPDHLFCMICTNVLREPCQMLCCRKYFSRSCSDKWYKNCTVGPSCPHCRSKSKIRRNAIGLFHEEISKLKVRCIHWSKGCQWTGELLMLRNHLSGDLCGKTITPGTRDARTV